MINKIIKVVATIAWITSKVWSEIFLEKNMAIKNPSPATEASVAKIVSID
jgi:hypothetical protein